MLFVKEPPRGQADALTESLKSKGLAAYRAVLSITTLWWIVLSGLLFNFNSYAVNTFQTAFLQRFHEIGLREATNISAISLGLTGAIGLLLGGWLGDRLRLKYANGRLMLAGITMLIAAPCVFFALQQPKGATGMFTLLMGAASAHDLRVLLDRVQRDSRRRAGAAAWHCRLGLLLCDVCARCELRLDDHGWLERLLREPSDACGRCERNGAAVQVAGTCTRRCTSFPR